jgi:hypothetical protein
MNPACGSFNSNNLLASKLKVKWSLSQARQNQLTVADTMAAGLTQNGDVQGAVLGRTTAND